MICFMYHEFGNTLAGRSVSKLCKILTNTEIEPGLLNKIASALTVRTNRTIKRFMLEINKAITKIVYKVMHSMQIKVNPGLSEKYSNSSSRQQKK